MKKFRFRLETPLQWRQMQEDLQKEKISKCQERVRRIDETINRYQEEQAACYGKMRDLHNGVLNLDSLRNHGDYLQVIQSKLLEEMDKRAVAQEALAQAQREMMEILQAKKVLERLKAKHFNKYLKAVNDLDQKLNDELASVAFNRKEREHRI